MIDGDLRQIFQRFIPDAHWQSIETGSTGRGIPDVNYCFEGIEGWIEFKATEGWRVDVRPEQVAWIERRGRAGGRVFLAVRRAQLELWFLRSTAARVLATPKLGLRDLENSHILSTMKGGPSRWPWGWIKRTLKEGPF